ncbi:hypothetical protein IMY05_005G0074400 [Salix suchowensis]|nr:hypothetical protein IMY05_005G0074400 [Salix suchowensis]
MADLTRFQLRAIFDSPNTDSKTLYKKEVVDYLHTILGFRVVTKVEIRLLDWILVLCRLLLYRIVFL